MAGGELKENNLTLAVIQARMGSSRLPGKMMMELGGRPILFWVLHRVKKANLVDSITLATSSDKRDDPLVELAQNLGINVFRGSENDVLERLIGAGEKARAEGIIRICADNPFVSPEEIDRLAEAYLIALKNGNHFERLYAFNFGPRMNNGYPDGLGGEMFSYRLLHRLNNLTSEPLYREHISNYIWDYPKDFVIHPIKAPKGIAFPHIKLDVNTIEDLEKLNILCCQLNPDSSALEIVKTYKNLFNVEG